MSTGCQIIKTRGLSKESCVGCDCTHCQGQAERRGNIKREREKEAEEREKFLPGALKVLELRMHGFAVVWFQRVHAK